MSIVQWTSSTRWRMRGGGGEKELEGTNPAAVASVRARRHAEMSSYLLTVERGSGRHGERLARIALAALAETPGVKAPAQKVGMPRRRSATLRLIQGRSGDSLSPNVAALTWCPARSWLCGEPGKGMQLFSGGLVPPSAALLQQTWVRKPRSRARSFGHLGQFVERRCHRARHVLRAQFRPHAGRFCIDHAGVVGAVSSRRMAGLPLQTLWTPARCEGRAARSKEHAC